MIFLVLYLIWGQREIGHEAFFFFFRRSRKIYFEIKNKESWWSYVNIKIHETDIKKINCIENDTGTCRKIKLESIKYVWMQCKRKKNIVIKEGAKGFWCATNSLLQSWNSKQSLNWGMKFFYICSAFSRLSFPFQTISCLSPCNPCLVSCFKKHMLLLNILLLMECTI